MTPWWERWPSLLPLELELLGGSGFEVTGQREVNGVMHLDLVAPDQHTGVGPVHLDVAFPDTYPRTCPQVVAPELDLKHHQHPFGRNLCLLGRSTTYWDSQSRLVDLLRDQLAKAITAGSGTPGDHDELDQAEPFASYYTFDEGIEVLLESEGTNVAPVCFGEASLRIWGPAPPVDPGQRLSVLVERLDGGDATVYAASEELKNPFHRANALTARWVVLGEPVRADAADQIWEAAELVDPGSPTAWDVGGGTGLSFRLIGFPDEVSRSQTGTGWVLVIKQAGPLKSINKRSGNPATRNQKIAGPDTYYLARVNRAGQRDLRARVPQTQGLAQKGVLLIGCGAIGSVVLEQLARAGLGSVILVDKDHLEPGNLARHAATMAHTGLSKSVAVAQLAQSVNPFITAEASVIAVGHPTGESGLSVSEYLLEAMARCDLVIDASAEVGVQEASADLARQAGRPWLGMSASEGAAGGSIVMVPPTADWCHACYQWHRFDEGIPFPNALSEGTVQPVGCAEPTFTGAGFDLAEVSLQAARVASATLLSGEPDGYPDDEFDAYTLTLRNPDGSRALPRWDGHVVTRHPKCDGHVAAHP